MDKEYLKKHNLIEAHKQFMRLAEGYLATSLAEADDDEDNQGGGQQQEPQPPMGDNPQMDGGQDAMPPMGNDGQEPPMDGGQDQMDGGQEPPMGDGDMPQDDMPPMEDGQEDGPMPEMDEPEEENEVIDVEDITKAQEKLNSKQNDLGHDLGQLDGRIESLLTAVEKMKGIIDHNNSEIVSLKAELEKRVPTQTEKLKMQSLHSYPYSVGLDKYWETHDGDGVYDINADEEPKKKVYTIKEKDIDDYTDGSIDRSLDDDLHQTMQKIFNGFN